MLFVAMTHVVDGRKSGIPDAIKALRQEAYNISKARAKSAAAAEPSELREQGTQPSGRQGSTEAEEETLLSHNSAGGHDSRDETGHDIGEVGRLPRTCHDDKTTTAEGKAPSLEAGEKGSTTAEQGKVPSLEAGEKESTAAEKGKVPSLLTDSRPLTDALATLREKRAREWRLLREPHVPAFCARLPLSLQRRILLTSVGGREAASACRSVADMAKRHKQVDSQLFHFSETGSTAAAGEEDECRGPTSTSSSTKNSLLKNKSPNTISLGTAPAFHTSSASSSGRFAAEIRVDGRPADSFGDDDVERRQLERDKKAQNIDRSWFWTKFWPVYVDIEKYPLKRLRFLSISPTSTTSTTNSSTTTNRTNLHEEALSTSTEGVKTAERARLSQRFDFFFGRENVPHENASDPEMQIAASIEENGHEPSKKGTKEAPQTSMTKTVLETSTESFILPCSPIMIQVQPQPEPSSDKLFIGIYMWVPYYAFFRALKAERQEHSPMGGMFFFPRSNSMDFLDKYAKVGRSVEYEQRPEMGSRFLRKGNGSGYEYSPPQRKKPTFDFPGWKEGDSVRRHREDQTRMFPPSSVTSTVSTDQDQEHDHGVRNHQQEGGTFITARIPKFFVDVLATGSSSGSSSTYCSSGGGSSSSSPGHGRSSENTEHNRGEPHMLVRVLRVCRKKQCTNAEFRERQLKKLMEANVSACVAQEEDADAVDQSTTMATDARDGTAVLDETLAPCSSEEVPKVEVKTRLPLARRAPSSGVPKGQDHAGVALSCGVPKLPKVEDDPPLFCPEIVTPVTVESWQEGGVGVEGNLMRVSLQRILEQHNITDNKEKSTPRSFFYFVRTKARESAGGGDVSV
ncbi:unnamed protein product [Amoebophrya sp. A25]|nr:unnamed protein product [Amoebophrya sp. A25]|eukprot:GSA25T00002647001.1